MTIYTNYGATPNDGVVIVHSSIPNLQFGILSVSKARLKKVVPDPGKNRYVLIIQPNDNYYRQYIITMNANGYKQGEIEGVVVKAGLSSGYIVNSKYDFSNDKGSGKKTPRVRKMKPETFTFNWDFMGAFYLGTTEQDASIVKLFSSSFDFTLSYFVLGFGVGVFSPPAETVSTNLVNSGYTGNFTRETTTKISGSPFDLFLDVGFYFKYFSFSCQVGCLCNAEVERTSSYEGWGYGLVDGDLNEYWGSYEQRSFTNSTSDKESHLTLTPQIKGHIPLKMGEKVTTGISMGLGYVFIPTMSYNVGLTGSLGLHYRF